MILFETIRWKNFLSTGNHFSEIKFNQHASTLITGSNGSGKSTVLDALTFGLFGKPFRKINKSQLINSMNEKDTKVEVEFSISKTDWKVVRGIKPNVFEIHRDGKCLDQFANANDQQKWFEQNVLKMNYKSFTQIVILGSSTFVPFMQLTSSNRREVIEDLLDIKIFSSMNNIIKEKIRGIKEEVKVLTLKKESLNDKVAMQEKFMDEIASQGKDRINLTKRQEEVTGATEKLRKLGNLKGKISQRVTTITKRINKIADAQTKAKELQSGYKELEEAIKNEEEREHQFTTLSKEITQLTHGISKNNTRISGCQRQIRDLESEIQRLTDQLADRNTEHEKLATFQESLRTTYDELSSRKDTINYNNFMYGLLKDGGVKTHIIKKYLPLINQQVNRYLQIMDFYTNFTLDEEFNETIQSPIHEDFSYASFSEGEKMRIDLALLFTWREVARMKNSVNTNLLILDEIFDSSLDEMGTEYFTKIIRFVIKDANVFVISHKTGMEDKFENHIKFEKVKGFSRIES